MHMQFQVLLTFLVIFATFQDASASITSAAELVPSFRDIDGNKAQRINYGQQVVATVRMVNSDSLVHPLVAIVELRDQDGITEYFAWQSHTLIANETYVFGSSWIPQKEGSYELRTFAVTDLQSPQALSAVNVAHLDVAG
jgi:hypothetical protein